MAGATLNLRLPFQLLRIATAPWPLLIFHPAELA